MNSSQICLCEEGSSKGPEYGVKRSLANRQSKPIIIILMQQQKLARTRGTLLLLVAACCYWSGICQASCPAGFVQLSSAATCDTAGNVCCVPSNLVGSTTPRIASSTTTSPTTTPTTTTSPPTVAERQGGQ